MGGAKLLLSSLEQIGDPSFFFNFRNKEISEVNFIKISPRSKNEPALNVSLKTEFYILLHIFKSHTVKLGYNEFGC
jgi:hypothetical protein